MKPIHVALLGAVGVGAYFYLSSKSSPSGSQNGSKSSSAAPAGTLLIDLSAAPKASVEQSSAVRSALSKYDFGTMSGSPGEKWLGREGLRSDKPEQPLSADHSNLLASFGASLMPRAQVDAIAAGKLPNAVDITYFSPTDAGGVEVAKRRIMDGYILLDKKA